MFVHHRGRHQLSVFRQFFSVQAAVHPVPFVTSPHTQFHTMAGQFPVHSFIVGDRRMKGFGLTGVSTGRSCQVAFCSCNRCIGCGSTKIQQGIVPGFVPGCSVSPDRAGHSANFHSRVRGVPDRGRSRTFVSRYKSSVLSPTIPDVCTVIAAARL